MKEHTFDTVVIGSGTSAYYCIDGLVSAGQKVAVIDKRPYGGTCALRGCQPKKYLVANAEAVAMASHLVGNGVVAAPSTDWAALQTLKNEFLNGISEGEVKELQNKGVATFHGDAVLTSENEVTVSEDRLVAEHIVIATGANPRRTDIPGSQFIHDSEYFLDLKTLPKRIVFLGGGYISFEFAHVAISAGAEVTILHRSQQPLKAFDPDMAEIVMEASASEGINLVVHETAESVEEKETGYLITGSSGTDYEADLIIEATGRVPNLRCLSDGKGNVAYSNRGIEVNAFMQSISNERVYAIGDCIAGSRMLAPVADEEGKVAAQNILKGHTVEMDYSVIPSAVFTIPNIGAVGLTEAQAKERGYNFRVNRGTTTGWPSSKRIGEKFAGYKVIINNEDNTILGAHLARHNASETINVFALAIKFGIKADELASFLWAYPTLTSDLKYMVK
jgi:glutathione reductase (NADPH)